MSVMRIANATSAAGARAAAGADRDAVLLGPVDEVPDDEEVAREPHLLDDRQLGGQPGPVLIDVELAAARRQVREALLEAAPGDVADVAVEGVTLGHAVLGQEGLAEVELDLAPLGDRDGALERLGHAHEVLVHLARRLQEVAVDRVLHPLLVGEALAGLDRHQHLVGGGVGAVDVVAVVGGDQRDVELGPHLDQRLVELLLLGRLGRHQLEEEVALAEDVLVLAGHRLGLGDAALGQGLRHLAAQARAHRDDALVALAQERLVDARVVVEALEVPHRVEVREVLVAGLVLGQQHQVVVAAVGAVAQVGGGDVGLAAEDHLDVVGLGLGVQVDRPEHVAVVGHRDGVHAAGLERREQVLHPDRAVEQAVLGVDVQVRELAHGR
jgi:hypothetical protein